jgi:type I restriction enzyme, S subunit
MSLAGWQPRPIGKCAKPLSGGTPSKARADFWIGDLPWVSSGEMAQRYIYDTQLHISEEGAKQGSRVVPPNTVLAVVRGMSLAREFRIALTRCTAAFNQDLKAFVCEPDVEPEFLFYALTARRDQVRELATEASHGTKKLEMDVLSAFPVLIPKIDVQKKVISVISAYDDLIENNRRRMALLEESARLLYQEWFIRLRFPGHEHTRAVDGVPQKWACVPIGQMADCVGGGTPSTSVSAYWEGGDVTWVTPTDVTRNEHLVLLDSENKITEAGLKSSSAKIVPPHAVLMTSRASIGFFAIVGREVCTNQGFISVVPHNPTIAHFLLFHLLFRREEIRSMGSGSTYAEVSRGKFKEFSVLIPEDRVVSLFSEQVKLVLDQVRTLKQQNQKLRQARDLLLPRLMSGEIAV